MKLEPSVEELEAVFTKAAEDWRAEGGVITRVAMARSYWRVIAPLVIERAAREVERDVEALGEGSQEARYCDALADRLCTLKGAP